MKRCPKCFQQVKAEHIECANCGQLLVVSSRAVGAILKTPERQDTQHNRNKAEYSARAKTSAGWLTYLKALEMTMLVLGLLGVAVMAFTTIWVQDTTSILFGGRGGKVFNPAGFAATLSGCLAVLVLHALMRSTRLKLEHLNVLEDHTVDLLNMLDEEQ